MDLCISTYKGTKVYPADFDDDDKFQVYIDGPFGAPTSQIFRAQHAVLVGTGIGVTPFASILQSIMHKFWQVWPLTPFFLFLFCKKNH